MSSISLVLFVGIKYVAFSVCKQSPGMMIIYLSPGVLSATVGHHFVHPSNRFYKALHGSGMLRAIFPSKFYCRTIVILTNLYAGLTGERVKPSDDYTLPDRYNIGIVSRRFT